MVWLPAATVLASGCARRTAASSGMDNMADASVPDWATSMQRGPQAYPDAEHVLPGPGSAGNLASTQHTMELAENAAATPSAHFSPEIALRTRIQRHTLQLDVDDHALKTGKRRDPPIDRLEDEVDGDGVSHSRGSEAETVGTRGTGGWLASA